MNTDLSIERLAALAPVRDDELVEAAETPAARALLATILLTPPSDRVAPGGGRRRVLPRRRRWVAAAAVAGAVGVAALVVLVSGGRNGASNAAAATLRRVAAVARAQPSFRPGPGQYLYTKSVNAYLDTWVPGGAQTAFNVLVPHVRQIWLGPEGGRLYETSGTPRFLTAGDRERWLADGRPRLTEAPSETRLPPAPPLDLPSQPNALYDRLEHDATGHGSGTYSEMFTLVGDSLRETSTTPAQRAALYEVAARIPGVELVGRVRDSAGRSGVAVAMTDDGIRSQLVFDPKTSALLAEEQVALPGNPLGYPAGTRVGYSTYLMQRVVDSDHAVH